jgi:hypothetical protein
MTPTATPTDTPTPTLTPTKTKIPTKTPSPTPGPYPAEWLSLLSDKFDSNSNGWRTDSATGDYGKIQFTLANGVYSINLQSTSAEGVLWSSIPDSAGSISDCFFSVEGTKISGPYDTNFGIIFRSSEKGYYLFTIEPSTRQYHLGLLKGDKWSEDPIPWVMSSAINTDKPNKLSILVQGTSFKLYINDRKVNEANDSSLSSGWFGLIVGLFHLYDTTEVAFDNMEVLGP